ncbi:SDR family oxidoreductase [Gordonia sp. ABSL11-1]|uniref:SDR family oxidoreductase n=1 Tax=Gordonia sp. ABSL11-1 TaxID=3053924 RepID=UPI002572DCD0|nr:SDR family oxidoreductase [Gordonia sp. ABSL11-1]MDL9948143.1 SDR family oxidoreductase [Gordonia sp. ABSL11-1]
MDLNQAVVMVTGASSGIGAATAAAAAAGGAHVVLLARRDEQLRRLAEEIDRGPGDALAVRCDVTDPEQISAAVRAALDAYGRIDVLVNNAGQGLQAGIEEIDPGDFEAVLRLNLVAPLRMMQAVVPTMRAQRAGSIVNISSGITLKVIPGSGAYAGSKAGLNQLSAIARAELATAGITVSTVYPFITATEFLDSIRAGHEAAAALERDHGPQPDSPERVAEAILDVIRTGAEQVSLEPA